MIQLGLHLIGDYIIQNDWMAINKKKRSWMGELACQTHCITYALPFFYLGSWQAVLAIYVSHYIIDRSRLVEYFLAARNLTWSTDNFGFNKMRPAIVSFWLYVIVDNTFHLACNYFALKYL